MQPFTYERAKTPAEAAAAVSRTPGAKFIAGGTNLLDLMKLEIEAPRHLVDVNALGLDRIEQTAEGGMRIGAMVSNTDLASNQRIRRGELGICGVGAALANAIYNATGVRVRDYPMTLDNMFEPLPQVA